MAQVIRPEGAEKATDTAAVPREAASEFPQPEELSALLPVHTYRVEGLLGRGGMGAVFRAVQVRLERPVAIKVMRREQGRDYDFEQRFRREALAMAKLNHPNIVSVIDHGEAGPEHLYIVMELVEGADLMDVIRTGRMTQEMALALLPQICDALQYAHDHGIVHRDIKPGNIMLTRDGRIKIADFGLAKRYDVESSFHTQSGTSMGTPDYAAPEQFTANAPIDHRADIYALGVMIYQMITGQLPRGVWKAPSQHAAVAPEWDEIVRHAMQTDPKDRYQAASEIKSDVSQITPPSSKPSINGAGETRRTPIVLSAIAIVLALGAFFALPQQKTPPRARGVSPAPSPASSSSNPVHPFAGHRYQFVPGALGWLEAKAKAEELGGHLATVTSREECAWIYATFGSHLDGARRASSIWLGASAEGRGQPFRWVTGEPFTFTDWNKDEPHFTTTTGQPAEGPFAISIKSRSGVLRWFDDPVDRRNTSAGFIVEWDSAAVPAPRP